VTRTLIVLSGLLALAGCRRDDQASRERETAQTSSAYSAGTDSGARAQQLEGTSSGTAYQAPQKIAGVTTTLGQLASLGHPPTQEDLTTFRNQLGSLQDAMRNDLSRAGQSDTGAFQAISDSLSRQLGGGPGGLAKELDPKEFPQVQARVQRLIAVYNERIGSTRR
jgi:hypothetical protein